MYGIVVVPWFRLKFANSTPDDEQGSLLQAHYPTSSQ